MRKLVFLIAVMLSCASVYGQQPVEGNNSSVEVALNLGENGGLTISSPALRYRYFFNSIFAARLQLLVNNSSQEQAGSELKSSTWTAIPAFEYHFSGNDNLDPFAFVGIGFGGVSSEFTDPSGLITKSESTSFGYSVGLGMDYYVIDRVYVGTEVGFSSNTVTTPVDGQTEDDKQSQSGFGATAGIRLGWRF